MKFPFLLLTLLMATLLRADSGSGVTFVQEPVLMHT